MNTINSGRKFFDFLIEIDLINNMLSLSPTGIIDHVQFHKELVKATAKYTVSQSAIDASNWVVNEIKYMDDRSREGDFRWWKEIDTTYNYYKDFVTYDRWFFSTQQRARTKRIDGLKAELILAEDRGDTNEIIRLEDKLLELIESRAFHSATGK